MLTVFVFPSGESTATAARLDRLMPGQDGYWTDEKLMVDLDDEKCGQLFTDWEPEDVRLLDSALGYHPTWALQVNVSGRIDGTAEIRSFLSHILHAGGVAIDDYSDHCWTLEEIDSEHKVDGLGFFDFRTHYERTHGRQPRTSARARSEGEV
ncbi:hypothetical protein [Streptomyces longispororuber]|uniref:hypothetical protein n=1 Tax=Streptomyces longispororuber TaxID=68230 RepID=UPI00210B89CF|nr:hypothetical protein [Streptomyces longispororuber]MCQ4206430.1 hypothetical protein [Streptomyces longispororuber]